MKSTETIWSGRSAKVRAVLCALLAIAVAPWASGCRKAAAPAPAVAVPAPAAPRAAAGADPFGLRPAERKAVQDFLGRHRNLRLPAEVDRHASASGDGDMRHLYGVYHPYFVRGDLNDDGVLDFVMAFVRRDSSESTPWFTVVVFPGIDGSAGAAPSFGAEIFLERDITLAAGDLSIDRDAVVITPDLDDDTTRRYRWDPARRSYVFVRDDEREVDPPDLSRT
ncbi:MAG: hypothetical protein ACM3SU_08315 [Acidobacteriota bacterium]